MPLAVTRSVQSFVGATPPAAARNDTLPTRCSPAGRKLAMSTSQIDAIVERQDRSVRDVAGTNEQRVADFYCSVGPPFFGAVVSTWSRANGPPEVEPAPVLVTLVGELDISTAPLLRACFAHIDGDAEVDCSGLDFVDARGLGVFVSARARGDEPHGRFVLVEPARCLSRLLRITGLDATFEIRRGATPVR
jgi:anti-anti-sigma factor